MIYNLELTAQAKKDLSYLAKTGDKALLKKVKRIFEELEQHPKTGIGKPEQLKHQFSGLWSRRIDEKIA